MARGLIRKPSFNKVIGAYRSQWKRFWLRLFTFGAYGRKGMGWIREPKRAWYNFWYYRTSLSVYNILGVKPSRWSCFLAMLIATAVSVCIAPVDMMRAGAEAHRLREERKTNESAASKTREGAEVTETVRDGETSGGNPTAKAVEKTWNIEEVSVKDQVRKSRPSLETQYKITSEKKESDYNFSLIYAQNENPKNVEEGAVKPACAVDERYPKSTPKNKGDQYIRKRMEIELTENCDKVMLDKITVGTYLEMDASVGLGIPDTVALTLEGKTVGYVPQSDSGVYLTCFKLKRKVYAVITDIERVNDAERYEFETWFETGR